MKNQQIWVVLRKSYINIFCPRLKAWDKNCDCMLLEKCLHLQIIDKGLLLPILLLLIRLAVNGIFISLPRPRRFDHSLRCKRDFQHLVHMDDRDDL